LTPDDAKFNQFIALRAADLQRIRRAARNEHELPDIIHEAWLLARDLRNRRDIPIDFQDPAYQQLLLSYLYNHLVRYTDRKIRTSVRLEAPVGIQTGDDLPTLGSILPGDTALQPLTTLIQREEQAGERSETEVPDTMVRGYVRLLGHFCTMRAVANHLLISQSHAYRCMNRAVLTAHIQPPVPTQMMDKDFMPGPWRKRRYQRIPLQASFDFDDELPLEHASEVEQPGMAVGIG
jgi:hypothetical protein